MRSSFWRHAGRYWIFVRGGVQPAPALGRCPSSQGTGQSNPTGEEHGQHRGDLGNITAAEDASAIVIHAEQEKTTGLPTG
jgi:hypothetical protein